MQERAYDVLPRIYRHAIFVKAVLREMGGAFLEQPAFS